ncbi:hypothetical protein IB024_01300 [Brucella sp. 6810]|uniref:ECs_2282 family putative zinc-binding protein n=1 Tax=Brucella sp. 6810 TaxID=2769351 RepID=UPI00165CEC13|nr:hypothetical protein [Brucella sp. 6810]QNQ62425.1 hypothetical protein IB024_01300 [Brucella sp. 6810]
MTDETDKITFNFKCPKCEGTVIALPDDPTDESIVTCKSCGVSFGPWGDIKARAMQMAKDNIRSEFKKSFKGMKNWKFK